MDIPWLRRTFPAGLPMSPAPDTWLTVQDGRVRCPTRGDVDVDACLECGRQVDAIDLDGTLRILCADPRSRGSRG